MISETVQREKLECLRCNGKGTIYFGRFGKRGKYRRGRGVTCKTCNGSGGEWREVIKQPAPAAESEE